MRELIRSLSQHATIIISTHILQEVQATCDRVIIVRNGQKALDARMEDLRAGKRLLVALDAIPEKATPLLGSIDGVEAVLPLDKQGPGYHYALDLSSRDSLADTAPLVASKVTTLGLRLYALQPETRDLEHVFGEISAR
jgi:ABC-2 type transport system ATP-binding protein